MRGTIKRLVTERGFGFLIGQDGRERFFHQSQTTGYHDLIEGDEVSFTPEDLNPKGPRAVAVTSDSQPIAVTTVDTTVAQEA